MLTPRRMSDANRHSDSGFTLAEVVVGVTLMIIAATIALNFLWNMGRRISSTTETLSSAAVDGTDTRFAMEQLTDVLRLADTPTEQPGYSTARFATITPSQLVFYSNLDARSGTAVRVPPRKIAITLSSDGVLTESQYLPLTKTYGANYNYTTNYPSSPSNSIVLLRYVTNPDVFGYCTSASDPSGTCVRASSPDQVSYVTVRLVVNPPTHAQSSTAPRPSPTVSTSAPTPPPCFSFSPALPSPSPTTLSATSSAAQTTPTACSAIAITGAVS